MSARIAVASAALFVLSACGLRDGAEEEALITDAELSAIQIAEQASTSTPTGPTDVVAPASAFHLRLAWGYLAGNRRPPEWVSWTGGAAVTSGAMQLEHVIFFEGRDFPIPAATPNAIGWRSRTLPHFDGVVARVTPGAATDQVTVRTPRFERTFDVASLAAGSEQHFVVDDDGHELSVSSVPADGCSGFSFGYLRRAPAGWLGFAGVVTNGRGQRLGVVRFRADGDVIQARAFSAGTLVAEGSGTLDAATRTFTIAFTRLDGTPAGTISGLYVEPSYSLRGSFQANGTGHCN